MQRFHLLFAVLLMATPLMGMILNSNQFRMNKNKGYPQIEAYWTLTTTNNKLQVGGDGLCKFCLSFYIDSVNELLNLILQGVVIGGCQELCQALADKTGSQTLGTICDLLCDIVGIEEFIKIIENADFDPFYFCQEVKTCPIIDTGKVTCLSAVSTPNKGPQGTFVLQLMYNVTNKTGPGEILLHIATLDRIPIGTGFVNMPQDVGMYRLTVKLMARPDPDCDPTQGPCESWTPGLYKWTMPVCNGECGSKKPHSQLYCEANGNFTITEKS